MKKISLVIFLFFIAGCGGPYNADGYNIWGYDRDGYQKNGRDVYGNLKPGYKTPAQILADKQNLLSHKQETLTQKVSALNNKYESLNMRLNTFVVGLSDEELQVYEKFASSAQSNPAAYELKRRALSKVLTEENAQILADLRQEYADLETEKSELIHKIQMFDRQVAEYNRNLQTYQQTVAKQQQARQAQARAFGQALQQTSQQYYNRQYQQQLLSSLNGIQTSVINLNQNNRFMMIPAPR